MGTLGVSDSTRLPALNKAGHVAHCVRCLDGLPASLVEMDASRYVSFSPLLGASPLLCLTCAHQPGWFWGLRFRMAIAFYCLGTLDVTGVAERQISPTDRESWKEWIWDQYVGEEYPLFLCLSFSQIVTFVMSSSVLTYSP